jgi:hypothetical protein
MKLKAVKTFSISPFLSNTGTRYHSLPTCIDKPDKTSAAPGGLAQERLYRFGL